MAKTSVEAKTQKAPEFTKAKILTFKNYRFRVDLLKVILDDTKTYSIKDVDTLIERFMKGKVK